MRIIVLIILLSIVKIDQWIDRKIDYYPLQVAKAFINGITRLNWSYGFFTSKSDSYQYLKYNISMVDEKVPITHEVTQNGALGNIGVPINAIRLNTTVQQIARDSTLLEAGSRAIALHLFNQHQYFRDIDFTICAHNCNISMDNNHYVINTSIDTLFDRRLSY